MLDMTRMDRVLNWDSESGIIDMEPGVTIQKMWKYIIADGWSLGVIAKDLARLYGEACSAGTGTLPPAPSVTSTA